MSWRESHSMSGPVTYRAIPLACVAVVVVAVATPIAFGYFAVQSAVNGSLFGPVALVALGIPACMWVVGEARRTCVTATFDAGRLRLRMLTQSRDVALAEVRRVIRRTERGFEDFTIYYSGGAATVNGSQGKAFVSAVADIEPRLTPQEPPKGWKVLRRRATEPDT